MSCGCVFFFFFQAEDGIRDLTVTGVQTCALPICTLGIRPEALRVARAQVATDAAAQRQVMGRVDLIEALGADTLTWISVSADRKSTRLNSSHSQISYAVFCLKKKKNKETKMVDSMKNIVRHKA